MKEKVYTVMPKTEGGVNGTASSLRHREALDGECTSHALHSSFEEEHRDSDANNVCAAMKKDILPYLVHIKSRKFIA